MSGEIYINEEFKKRLPALSPEERSRLKQQIAEAGEIFDPILYWESSDTIVDGHNRFEIYNELIEEGVKVKTPKYKPMKFDNREAVLLFIDEHALAKRNLSKDDFNIILGRIYNAEKKAQGRPEKQSDQVDHFNSDKTHQRIAKQHKVGEATVRRAGQRAEVYDAIVAEKGIDSDEAKAAKKAPQAVIEKVLASEKGKSMADTLMKEKKKARAKASREKKRATKPLKDETFYEDAPEAGFTKMLNAVKDAGPLPEKEFWSRIGGVTNQRWFKEFVRHIHYMHLQETDGNIELFIDESERDLCTAIENQLKRMRDWSKKQNRFKFDVDMYKKTIQDLYDLVNKASNASS